MCGFRSVQDLVQAHGLIVVKYFLSNSGHVQFSLVDELCQRLVSSQILNIRTILFLVRGRLIEAKDHVCDVLELLLYLLVEFLMHFEPFFNHHNVSVRSEI